MAKYDIRHACGHTKTHDICGPEKDRPRKRNWLADQACQDCARSATAAASAAVAADLALPALTGSPKQVEWADRIRGKAVPELLDYAAEMADEDEEDLAARLRAAVLDYVRAQTSASWWIDRREQSAPTLARPLNLIDMV